MRGRKLKGQLRLNCTVVVNEMGTQCQATQSLASRRADSVFYFIQAKVGNILESPENAPFIYVFSKAQS